MTDGQGLGGAFGSQLNSAVGGQNIARMGVEDRGFRARAALATVLESMRFNCLTTNDFRKACDVVDSLEG